MLRAFGHPVATCCEMLGVVGSNLKIVKFFMQHLRMIHDVVVVWPGSYNNVALGHGHWFDFQYPTRRNTSQQGGQTRATCCARQCCDMLRSNVTIVWPGLANAGPTMLRYAVLKCCDRLAGALKTTSWAYSVGFLHKFWVDLLCFVSPLYAPGGCHDRSSFLWNFGNIELPKQFFLNTQNWLKLF